MDYRLLEGVGSLEDKFLFGGKRNKLLLQNSISNKLPKYITQFRKVGFSVPWNKYIKEIALFRDVLEDLENYEIFKIGSYSKFNIPKLRNEFLSHGLHSSLITHMIFVAIWSVNQPIGKGK